MVRHCLQGWAKRIKASESPGLGSIPRIPAINFRTVLGDWADGTRSRGSDPGRMREWLERRYTSLEKVALKKQEQNTVLQYVTGRGFESTCTERLLPSKTSKLTTQSIYDNEPWALTSSSWHTAASAAPASVVPHLNGFPLPPLPVLPSVEQYSKGGKIDRSFLSASELYHSTSVFAKAGQWSKTSKSKPRKARGLLKGTLMGIRGIGNNDGDCDVILRKVLAEPLTHAFLNGNRA